MTRRKLTYLACPYNSPSADVRRVRFEAASREAVKMMISGLSVYSPVTHVHGLVLAGGLPIGWEFFLGEEHGRAMLECSFEVAVLMLDGWKESVGVQAEIAIAESLGLRVRYVNPLAEENRLARQLDAALRSAYPGFELAVGVGFERDSKAPSLFVYIEDWRDADKVPDVYGGLQVRALVTTTRPVVA